MKKIKCNILHEYAAHDIDTLELNYEEKDLIQLVNSLKIIISPTFLNSKDLIKLCHCIDLYEDIYCIPNNSDLSYYRYSILKVFPYDNDIEEWNCVQHIWSKHDSTDIIESDFFNFKQLFKHFKNGK